MPLRPIRPIASDALPDPSVLYCDKHIVVVEKPTMMLSVPGRGPDKTDCVVSRLAKRRPPLVVHRLDMETSGLLVMAWTQKAQAHLNQQFMNRTVSKTYEAIVYGQVADDTFEINLPLITDWPNRPRQIVDHKIGKSAITQGQVIERFPETTRVSLTPITGRSHQLRVHMLALGHPILGDSLYAPEAAYTSANRMLLHAKQITFIHPETGHNMSSHSSVPF